MVFWEEYAASGIKSDVVILKWQSFSDEQSKTILHTSKVYEILLEVLYCGIIIDCNAHNMIDNQNVSA